MNKPMTRRKFLQGVAAATVLPASLPSISHGAYTANSKVRHAAIGCRGMGALDLESLASHPHLEVVALCDIDDRYLNGALKKYPRARCYNDFRVLFERERANIDSCHVTVPDHMHAPIAMTAILAGKHVYCQKPLSHEIDEARKLRLAAHKAGVVTQMGTQIHSHSAYRTAVQLIQRGVVGKVKEVHTWSSGAWTNNGRPQPAEPPTHIHWDLWLGVASSRPWGPGAYHPREWWSWLDFGTGNLGDMGCHLLDPVVKSLELGLPTRVRAEVKQPKLETWPNAGKVFYEFSGTKYTLDPINWTWYDGGFDAGHHPPSYMVPGGRKLPSQGSLFIGEKGVLLLPHVAQPVLLPEERFKDFKVDPLPSLNHWHSFVDACRGEGETTAGFDYAGPLTETVLVGNLAKRFPSQVLRWNGDAMRVTNFSEANDYIRRQYRKGWEIEGLS